MRHEHVKLSQHSQDKEEAEHAAASTVGVCRGDCPYVHTSEHGHSGRIKVGVLLPTGRYTQEGVCVYAGGRFRKRYAAKFIFK